MTRRPHLLAKGPNGLDVLADVLQTNQLKAVMFGRLELGTPWALSLPANGLFAFYVVARGGAWLEVEGAKKAAALSSGDLMMLPHGPAHVLRDAGGSRAKALALNREACAALHAAPATKHLGGDGPATTLISGCFRFGEGASNPILASLPKAMLLRSDDPQSGPWLGATVQLLIAESNAPGPASGMVLGRLADVLLIQALRTRARSPDSACVDKGGLRALTNPSIAAALNLMHSHPEHAWTVESLASQVSVSRSGFSAKFAELVGVPPLHYLAQWRMTKAAQLLRETDDSLNSIAERVGYESDAAFNKAFKRMQGIAPGAYRRARQ